MSLRRRGPARGTRRAWLAVAAVTAALVGFNGAAVAGGLVTGRQIKNGTVESVDLMTNRGVAGSDVHDGTLSPDKFASLPAGPQGPAGQQGPPGPNGLDNFNYEQAPFSVDKDSDGLRMVPCPSGTIVVGGGASSDSTLFRTVASHPLANGSGWQVIGHNDSALNPVDAFAWAVCVSVQ